MLKECWEAADNLSAETMLVSIHIPKTAGSSLNLSLKERFGASCRNDSADTPFTGESPLDRKTKVLCSALQAQRADFEGVACVHGHFLAFKYSLLAEKMPCSFAVWLRHPVARLMSHYYYWVDYYANNPSYGSMPQCVEEGWSFERFSLCEDFRNMQCEFVWGVPLSRFEFVGLTEHYEEDFALFSRSYLGKAFEPIRTNTTPSRPGIETLDEGLRREIEHFHALDMALYHSAVERRERRLNGDLMPMAVIEDRASQPV